MGFPTLSALVHRVGWRIHSYDFLGDPAVNIDMSSFDEFVSDNFGNMRSKVSAKTVSEPQVEAVGTPSSQSR